MKLLFLDNNISTPFGSNRIYMKNLMYWVAHLGHEVSYNGADYQNFDVIIFDKSFVAPLSLIRDIKKKSNAIVGIANNTSPSISEYDFCIAACQTEWVHSVQYNPNVFRFPQIERFEGYKKHENVREISLCYHGNLEHLEQLNPNIIKSLEILSEKFRIKLKAIYNLRDLGLWEINRPKIDIEDIQWDFDRLALEIIKCDIGLVPSNLPISKKEKKCFFKLQQFFSRLRGASSNDHLLRFKCCSNAGRAFVFHQLGLPVVSEMNPDAYHILQSYNTGYIAQNKESWLVSLERLCSDYVHRQSVADKAKAEFDRLYDPLMHTQNLLNDLENLRINNRRDCHRCL